jgi:hypothetical protein
MAEANAADRRSGKMPKSYGSITACRAAVGRGCDDPEDVRPENFLH